MMENKAEVVVAIPNAGGESVESLTPKQSRYDSPHRMCNDNEIVVKSPLLHCASPEIRFIPSPNKPPKVPPANANLTRRKSLARSVFSKPKSRFGEQPYPIDGNILEENNIWTLQEQMAVNSPYRYSFSKASLSNKSGTVNRVASITPTFTPKTPLMASSGEDEGEIIYKLKNIGWNIID